jgi:CRP-like cAMP-binding protein
MASDHLADLLQVVDAEMRRDVETALQPETLRAGEVLFRQGDPPGDVFFLRSGRLGVRLQTAEGTEAEIDVLAPGAGVGEIGFVTGQPRAATVYALEACELRRLPVAALDQLTARRPRAMADYARAMLPRLQPAQLAGVLTGLFGPLDPAALKQLQYELEWRALPRGSALPAGRARRRPLHGRGRSAARRGGRRRGRRADGGRGGAGRERG